MDTATLILVAVNKKGTRDGTEDKLVNFILKLISLRLNLRLRLFNKRQTCVEIM